MKRLAFLAFILFFAGTAQAVSAASCPPRFPSRWRRSFNRNWLNIRI